MYEEQHEPGEKKLLNGFVIPAGQSGREDVKMAINHLVNHPNTAPFISIRLIQRLVSSNPSSAYVKRVAEVFENNGQGIRGDLGAVVKAILLDPEARNCPVNSATVGKLREPVIRYSHILNAFNATNETGNYWYTAGDMFEGTRQLPMLAPSVFNFFRPDYQPNGPIAEQGLLGPEYQIHNTSTSIGYINLVNLWTFWGLPLETGEEYYVLGTDVPESEIVRLDLESWMDIENNEVLVDEMDLLMCHGQLSNNTRRIIVQALDQLNEAPEDRVLMAIYLFAISPDYNVIK